MAKYRKFIAFGVEDYDACGGMDDIQGSADTLDEAIALLARHPWPFDQKSVVDRDTWEVVWSAHHEDAHPMTDGPPVEKDRRTVAATPSQSVSSTPEVVD